jgi:carnitine-CoA ligase
MIDDRISVPAAIERRAAGSPSTVCLRDVGGRSVTYAGLHAEARAWGRALVAAGIQAGDRVATLVPNSIDMVAIWLGTGWAGGVDLAINTAYRGEMLAHGFRTSKPTVLLIASEFLGHYLEIQDEAHAVELVVVIDAAVAPAGVSAVTLTRDQFLEAAEPATPLSAPALWDVQGIVYTSGSTGASKGVLVPWGRHYTGRLMLRDWLTVGDVWYSAYPPCHGAAKNVLRILGYVGTPCVLAASFKTQRFWSDVDRYGCTATMLLPSMQHWLATAPATGNDRGHALEQILGYGDALAPFAARYGVRTHVNYGSTEAGQALWELDVPSPGHGYAGQVRPPYYARVVDEHDYEVPRGTPGEMVIRCDEPWMMFAGYEGRDDATVAATRNGWYHTGDGFVQGEDGAFRFVERRSDYIRRRGENISSWDVERFVAEHPDVAEVAAIGVPDPDGEDEVKICVARAPGSSLTAEDLLGYVAAKMPRFMVPRYVEFMASLPKTPGTEKVQKGALRAAALSGRTWDSRAGPGPGTGKAERA